MDNRFIDNTDFLPPGFHAVPWLLHVSESHHVWPDADGVGCSRWNALHGQCLWIRFVTQLKVLAHPWRTRQFWENTFWGTLGHRARLFTMTGSQQRLAPLAWTQWPAASCQSSRGQPGLLPLHRHNFPLKRFPLLISVSFNPLLSCPSLWHFSKRGLIALSGYCLNYWVPNRHRWHSLSGHLHFASRYLSVPPNVKGMFSAGRWEKWNVKSYRGFWISWGQWKWCGKDLK